MDSAPSEHTAARGNRSLLDRVALLEAEVPQNWDHADYDTGVGIYDQYWWVS